MCQENSYQKMNFKYLADHEEAIPIIAKWYFNEWGHRAKENSMEEFSLNLQKYLNRDKIPLMVLAIDSEKIIGTAQLKYREMDIYPNKEHWIGGIFVTKQYRGNSVATRLIKKTINIAQSLDVNILHLQTVRLDGGLYTRLGWKPIEQVQYKGLNVLVMEKHLGT
ncbi:MAG: GNAT family N-acetyltransferase [Balneolaceae bacterium]